MKVLHLLSERSWRGGEQQAAYLIQGLEERGVECVVACKKNSAFESYCQKHRINHLPLGFRNELDLFTAWDIRNFCREFNIRIMHVHTAHAHAIAVWASLLGANTKIVVSRRVDFKGIKNWFSRYKYNYDGIVRYICVSEAIRKILSEEINQPEKCVTVYSGIDPHRFNGKAVPGKLRKALGLTSNCKIIANVSAIAPHKDYFTFVDVAEKLVKQEQNVHFAIIGDGPERARIEEYITEKNMQRHITMMGFRSDIEEIMGDIDVLLITSKTEGLGTTILDAFANHIPVVATQTGGIPEAVQHEVTGLLARPRDVSRLAASVQRLLNDPKLTTHVTTNAGTLLEKQFSITGMVEGNLRQYRKVAPNV